MVNELRGEKIDIIPFSDMSDELVAKALSPAKVKEVRFLEADGTAEVIVPDHQLSLAIGREGQNARLAARLTGWRVDIKSETQLADEEAGFEGEEWAEGEWITDPETGEYVWKPAEGGDVMSAADYASEASTTDKDAEVSDQEEEPSEETQSEDDPAAEAPDADASEEESTAESGEAEEPENA